MKKYKPFWLALLILLPFVTVAGTSRWRMLWTALPAEQIVHGECQVGTTWQEVGTAPGNGSIAFELTGTGGDRRPCRAFTTLLGLPDSPRSEVVVVVLPLDEPRDLRVVQEP